MDKNNRTLFQRLFGVFKKLALPFFAGFIFALLCFLAINAAMEPVSTSEYCGTACHEMDEAYQSWKASTHGTNEKGLHAECIECHLLPPKDKFFTHIAAKACAGVKDLYKHYFGGEYDIEKTREKVAEHFENELCLKCHIDLLSNPGTEGAKELHLESLEPDNPADQIKCIECHEEAGHMR